MNGNHSRPMIAMLIISVVWWSREGLGQEPAVERSTLAQVRVASPQTFTLEVEVDRPANGELPGQGNTTQVMRVTIGKDITAIVWKASQLPVPTYYPPDARGYEPMDYDQEGNLTVAMWSEGATMRDQTIHEDYSESIGSVVAPNGAVVRQGSGAFLNRRRPSDSNTESLNLVCRILWALGRPRVEGLGAITSEQTTHDGSQHLRAAGGWATTSGGGISELVIEPSNGHLVREATFGAEGEPPRAECRSEGIRRFADVVLAQRGEFILRNIETITVRLVSFSPTFDPQLVAEARKVISRAQTRLVHVTDKRDDPDHPKLRLVPAGDLDKDE